MVAGMSPRRRNTALLDTLSTPPEHVDLSPYITFTRDSWATRRANEPLTLKESELEALRGINSEISMTEVIEVYLPLSRLLDMYVSATRELYTRTAQINRSEERRIKKKYKSQ